MFGYGDGDVAERLYGRGFPEPRFYFHARTAVPMRAGDLLEGEDSDNEDDNDEWENTVKRDMYTSKHLTKEERIVMVSWKRYERRHGNAYFADYIMPDRCEAFVRECAPELRESGTGARHALVVHLLMLWEFALIDGGCMDRCLRIYDGEEVAPIDRSDASGGSDSGDEDGEEGGRHHHHAQPDHVATTAAELLRKGALGILD
mmetsp:Transcript_7320/g.18160  ORF Transcript_7320/g.18160 Transcript_7320/m.18160 type:complete len:203 (-) Transcript_7320:132-740(-)